MRPDARDSACISEAGPVAGPLGTVGPFPCRGLPAGSRDSVRWHAGGPTVRDRCRIQTERKYYVH